MARRGPQRCTGHEEEGDTSGRRGGKRRAAATAAAAALGVKFVDEDQQVVEEDDEEEGDGEETGAEGDEGGDEDGDDDDMSIDDDVDDDEEEEEEDSDNSKDDGQERSISDGGNSEDASGSEMEAEPNDEDGDEGEEEGTPRSSSNTSQKSTSNAQHGPKGKTKAHAAAAAVKTSTAAKKRAGRGGGNTSNSASIGKKRHRSSSQGGGADGSIGAGATSRGGGGGPSPRLGGGSSRDGSNSRPPPRRWVVIGKTDDEANAAVTPSPVPDEEFDGMVRSCVRNDAIDEVKEQRATLLKRLHVITGGKDRPDVMGQATKAKNNHWDFLLKEMMWMADDFRAERKRHTSGRRKMAKSVSLHFKGREAREAKKVKEEQLSLRRGASRIAREVRGFWAKLNKVIAYKQRLEADECRRKAMDKHLVFLVKQTERYSSILVDPSRPSVPGQEGSDSGSSSSNGSNNSNSSDESSGESEAEGEREYPPTHPLSSSAEDADPMQEEDQSDMADDEEDAFSDDSAVAMQDDLLLLRSEDAGDSFPALAAAEQRSGDGDGGGAADGASGVESRGSIENGLVSGGRPSGLGEEVQSEKAGDEDEEEYSDPGEESLRDDEATLSEEERLARREANGDGPDAARNHALDELRHLREDGELPVAAVVTKLYPATKLASPQLPSQSPLVSRAPLRTASVTSTGASTLRSATAHPAPDGVVTGEPDTTGASTMPGSDGAAASASWTADHQGSSEGREVGSTVTQEGAAGVAAAEASVVDGGSATAMPPPSSLPPPPPRRAGVNGHRKLSPGVTESRDVDGKGEDEGDSNGAGGGVELRSGVPSRSRRHQRPTSSVAFQGGGSAAGATAGGGIGFGRGGDGASAGGEGSSTGRLERWIEQGGAGETAGDEEGEFVPMDEEVDDETTLDAEEALANGSAGEDAAGEVARLQAEADMPIEELMRLAYGKGSESGSNSEGGDGVDDDDDDDGDGDADDSPAAAPQWQELDSTDRSRRPSRSHRNRTVTGYGKSKEGAAVAAAAAAAAAAGSSQRLYRGSAGNASGSRGVEGDTRSGTSAAIGGGGEATASTFSNSVEGKDGIVAVGEGRQGVEIPPTTDTTRKSAEVPVVDVTATGSETKREAGDDSCRVNRGTSLRRKVGVTATAAVAIRSEADLEALPWVGKRAKNGDVEQEAGGRNTGGDNCREDASGGKEEEEDDDEGEDGEDEFVFREEADDEATLEVEDALAQAAGGTGADDAAAELADLAAEADLPLEELRRRAYGGAGSDVPSDEEGFDENEDAFSSDDCSSEEDVDRGEQRGEGAGVGAGIARGRRDLKALVNGSAGAEELETDDGALSYDSGDADEDYEDPEVTELDDEATLEEEERRAREEAADADGDGRKNELHQLQADGELPLDELLRRYGYATNQNNDEDEDDDRSSEMDSEVRSSSAVSGTTAGAPAASIAALESEKEQKGAGLGSAGKGIGNSGEEGKLESGSDGGRGEQEDGDSGQEEMDEGGGEASDNGDDALRRLEAADVAARALRVPRPFMLAKSLRLREYQHAGLSWLVSLHERRLNGILADEMGLGKTVQTISLLAYLACHKGVWGPHLIVVPTSCIVNWETELKRFLPGFKVLTYYGNAKQRKELRTGWTKLNAFHVCITSYQLAVQDASSFKRKKWYHLILDEAQNIKNFKSQRWQTLLTFNSQRRLLLTGTPLQNSLMELWSLMHFLMPHVFRSRKEFSYWFSQPLTHMVEGSRERNDDLIRRLHSVVRPFLLRRLKRDVEKQLPGKHEHVVMCKLSRRQAALYEEFMSRSSTRAALQGGNFMGMMNILMQLRKVCNHPDLFEARQIDSPFVLPALELSVGTQILRSPLRFPVGVGGVTSAWAVGGGGGGGAWGLSTSGESGISSDFAGVVSPRLIAPLWAHDLSDGLAGLDNIATEYLSKWSTPAEMIIRTASKLPLPVPDPAQVDPTLNLMPQIVVRLNRLRKALRGEGRNRRRLMAALSLHRCGLLPGGGGGGAGMGEPHPLNWRLVKTATLPAGHTPLHAAQLAVAGNARLRLWCAPSLMDAVKGIDRRCEEMRPAVERFCFLVPRVITWSPTVIGKPDPASDRSLSMRRKELKAKVEERGGLQLTYPAQVRQRICFPDRRLVQYDAGKLQVLAGLLRSRKQGGHKCLIFTQMSRMLDVLEEFLTLHGHTYVRLDGSTGVEKRQRLMDRFNLDPRLFCFILSTRSGGLGINLTGADTVIFYDSDWNPAMDAQAQDRAHRIGQTREVHIYRLVTSSSIEENILKKAQQKRHLDFLVMTAGNFSGEQQEHAMDYMSAGGLKDILGANSIAAGSSSPSTGAGAAPATVTSGEVPGGGGAKENTGEEDQKSKEDEAAAPQPAMSAKELKAAMATFEDDDDVEAGKALEREAADEQMEFDDNGASTKEEEKEDDNEVDDEVVDGSANANGPNSTGTSPAPAEDDGESKEKTDKELEEEFAAWQNRVGLDISALEASLAPIERYALRVRTEVDPYYSLYFLTEAQRREEVGAAGGDLDVDTLEAEKEAEERRQMESGELLACHVGKKRAQRQRELFTRDRARAVSERKKRVLTGDAWERRADAISKVPFWYNRDTGEAIWDKPEVVSEMEAHARALELRYSGLPQPLMLKILAFMPPMPDRMTAGAVCSSWLEGTRHKTFKLKVLPVESGIQEAAALAQSLASAVPTLTPTASGGVETPVSPVADGLKAAAAAAGARLETGQYASVADALAAAQAGDTVVLGAGHHLEGDLSAEKPVIILGDAADPSRVVLEMTGTLTWYGAKGLIRGITLQRPRALPKAGTLITVAEGGTLQLSCCGIDNLLSGEDQPALNAIGTNAVLFLERCTLQGSRGPGVVAEPGGSVAIVGCELKRCGGAGLHIKRAGRAVLNDSYVYWNRGPGVRVDKYGVVSLEHNDCSLNEGGPMEAEGSVRVSRRNCCLVRRQDVATTILLEGFRPHDRAPPHAPYYDAKADADSSQDDEQETAGHPASNGSGAGESNDDGKKRARTSSGGKPIPKKKRVESGCQNGAGRAEGTAAADPRGGAGGAAGSEAASEGLVESAQQAVAAGSTTVVSANHAVITRTAAVSNVGNGQYSTQPTPSGSSAGGVPAHDAENITPQPAYPQSAPPAPAPAQPTAAFPQPATAPGLQPQHQAPAATGPWSGVASSQRSGGPHRQSPSAASGRQDLRQTGRGSGRGGEGRSQGFVRHNGSVHERGRAGSVVTSGTGGAGGRGVVQGRSGSGRGSPTTAVSGMRGRGSGGRGSLVGRATPGATGTGRGSSPAGVRATGGGARADVRAPGGYTSTQEYLGLRALLAPAPVSPVRPAPAPHPILSPPVISPVRVDGGRAGGHEQGPRQGHGRENSGIDVGGEAAATRPLTSTSRTGVTTASASARTPAHGTANSNQVSSRFAQSASQQTSPTQRDQPQQSAHSHAGVVGYSEGRRLQHGGADVASHHRAFDGGGSGRAGSAACSSHRQAGHQAMAGNATDLLMRSSSSTSHSDGGSSYSGAGYCPAPAPPVSIYAALSRDGPTSPGSPVAAPHLPGYADRSQHSHSAAGTTGSGGVSGTEGYGGSRSVGAQPAPASMYPSWPPPPPQQQQDQQAQDSVEQPCQEDEEIPPPPPPRPQRIPPSAQLQQQTTEQGRPQGTQQNPQSVWVHQHQVLQRQLQQHMLWQQQQQQQALLKAQAQAQGQTPSPMPAPAQETGEEVPPPPPPRPQQWYAAQRSAQVTQAAVHAVTVNTAAVAAQPAPGAGAQPSSHAASSHGVAYASSADVAPSAAAPGVYGYPPCPTYGAHQQGVASPRGAFAPTPSPAPSANAGAASVTAQPAPAAYTSYVPYTADSYGVQAQHVATAATQPLVASSTAQPSLESQAVPPPPPPARSGVATAPSGASAYGGATSAATTNVVSPPSSAAYTYNPAAYAAAAHAAAAAAASAATAAYQRQYYLQQQQLRQQQLLQQRQQQQQGHGSVANGGNALQQQLYPAGHPPPPYQGHPPSGGGEAGSGGR